MIDDVGRMGYSLLINPVFVTNLVSAFCMLHWQALGMSFSSPRIDGSVKRALFTLHARISSALASLYSGHSIKT